MEYTLEQREGGIRLRVTSDIQWKFPMNIMSLFIGSRMKAGITAQLKEELEKLKELCEMDRAT